MPTEGIVEVTNGDLDMAPREFVNTGLACPTGEVGGGCLRQHRTPRATPASRTIGRTPRTTQKGQPRGRSGAMVVGRAGAGVAGGVSLKKGETRITK